MARGKKQVEIIDDSNLSNFYDPDSVREAIKDKYGEIGSQTNVYLYRQDAKGEWGFLSTYTDLPDFADIQKSYGGGNYKLYIKWKDESDTSRVHTKIFKIEGNPIYSTYSPEKMSGNAPTSDDNDEMRLLTRLKLYNELFSQKSNNSNTPDASIKLIMEAMKENQQMVLELIKNKDSGGVDKEILKTLLATSLQKSNGLDDITKVATLLETLKGDSGDGGFFSGIKAKDMINLLPLLTSKKPAVSSIAGNPGITQLPLGNEVLQLLTETINNAVQPLVTKIENIDNRLKNIEKDFWISDENENENNSITEQTEVQNITDINQDNSLEIVNKFLANKIKYASESEKIEQLKQWVSEKGARTVFEWCMKYEVINDLEGFNEYMKNAGLEELVL